MLFNFVCEYLTSTRQEDDAFFNRALLNLDFYSQPHKSLLLHQLIFKHLDAALQDFNRVLTINPHNKDAMNVKNLLIEDRYHITKEGRQILSRLEGEGAVK